MTFDGSYNVSPRATKDGKGFVSTGASANYPMANVVLVKALLARGANPNVRVAKGTPMRRDTTDWNLPATLIGSTPYLLAAKFLEPEIMPVSPEETTAAFAGPPRNVPSMAKASWMK